VELGPTIALRGSDASPGHSGLLLDGFIARPNGALDFLDASGGGAPHGYDEFVATWMRWSSAARRSTQF
jgi:hypothetical protein